MSFFLFFFFISPPSHFTRRLVRFGKEWDVKEFSHNEKKSSENCVFFLLALITKEQGLNPRVLIPADRAARRTQPGEFPAAAAADGAETERAQHPGDVRLLPAPGPGRASTAPGQC